MKILRTFHGINLNEGNLAASGLFNLFDIETNEVSDWFDTETKDELLLMSDSEFYEYAQKNIENSVNKIW